VPYLPHGQILPHAACVICHGGFGTTQKALAAGVPVVAIPFARDQFEVARRVEVARAGVLLSRTVLTPERIRVAVAEAMQCKRGAERIAAAFRTAGGEAMAASAIEELLQGAASCASPARRAD
jgi:UDP:flavonoid glycosyltransferase YjiC (YdhE family)